jgi:hypothetical protein
LNKVVARYRDGRVLKGYTLNFHPTKRMFHVSTTYSHDEDLAPVRVRDLKALFFVKDLTGDPTHVMTAEFEPGHRGEANRIRVDFEDGEVLLGTTAGYDGERSGFFLVPADDSSNILRSYVVTSATEDVCFV